MKNTGWRGRNWLGKNWMIQYNNGNLPSLNQIEAGLIVAAIDMMQKKIREQDQLGAKLIFEAHRNL
jgi:hypothetical protein|tara:strand:- start:352 stop:549 length:198 start_codon:yes stop_codon:yes gene_type:complete